ncbi:hypothetical protein [Sinomicrobium weinanense]|uniref:Uncharacterized protein n=1 Tax=Sinomicrobium weinanense TaxID=2842200 RepID=A0A926JPW1_9FLAO|nr:hypothetical protein [Sinomicrobium weinanense]MBC9795138.1 hypothetical protein [Sinomicrobium weinanense]MBU3123730.1 hypothetical protein [Sinomicrobium weinanense]
MMNTQNNTRRPPRPESFRLRKVKPEDDYVDFLHHQAQGPRPRHLRRWAKQAALVLVLLSAFLYAGPLLRLADSTAATVDAGTLSLLLLVLLGAAACHLLACVLTTQLYRSFRRLLDSSFTTHSIKLNSWQHLCIYFGGYVSLFWGMATWLSQMM